MSVRDMSQSGVSVGRKEKSPCELKHYPHTKSEVPTEDLEVSTWFSGHIGVGDVIVIESGVMIDFFNKFV